jgi:hypothetical protein
LSRLRPKKYPTWYNGPGANAVRSSAHNTFRAPVSFRTMQKPGRAGRIDYVASVECARARGSSAIGVIPTASPHSVFS